MDQLTIWRGFHRHESPPQNLAINSSWDPIFGIITAGFHETPAKIDAWHLRLSYNYTDTLTPYYRELWRWQHCHWKLLYGHPHPILPWAMKIATLPLKASQSTFECCSCFSLMQELFINSQMFTMSFIKESKTWKQFLLPCKPLRGGAHSG